MSIYKLVLHDILAVYNKRLLCYVFLGSITATCADVLNPSCKAIFCINRLLLTVQERKPFDFCLCLTSSHAAGSKQALSGIITSRPEECFCFSRPSSSGHFWRKNRGISDIVFWKSYHCVSITHHYIDYRKPSYITGQIQYIAVPWEHMRLVGKNM